MKTKYKIQYNSWGIYDLYYQKEYSFLGLKLNVWKHIDEHSYIYKHAVISFCKKYEDINVYLEEIESERVRIEKLTKTTYL